MFGDSPFLGRDNNFERAATPEEPVVTGRARIRVVGVGGAGNNAVNRMIDAGISSADYIAVNTDAQILACNQAGTRIQIGAHLTKGLGAGANPEIGRNAAEESKEELTRAIENTDLLFITAGMGGGTGTGAAPVIAKIAKEKEILTVAVVTEPFSFEGRRRMENTITGIENLRKYVDTIIIIPNEKIADVAPKGATMEDALRVADDVLRQGIRGIADLIVTPSLINLDFADVKTILKDRGLAHMGVGVAKGENRIIEAVRLAVNCPLLETTIEGATGVILNVVGGNDLTFEEVRLAASLIHSVVDSSANIIFGACIDKNITDEVEVTVIATGFPSAEKLAQVGARGVTSGSRAIPIPKPAQPPVPAPVPTPAQYGSPVYAEPQYAQSMPVAPAPAPAAPQYGAPAYAEQQYAQPTYPAAEQQQYAEPVPAPVPVPPAAPAPAPAPAPEQEPVLDDEPNTANPRDQKLPPFVQRLLGKRK